MADYEQERTHQPTLKRRRDIKESGQNPRSKDLNTFLVVIAGILVLYTMSHSISHCFIDIMTESLAPKLTTIITLDVIKATLFHAIYRVCLLLIPLFVALVICSIIGSIVMGGFNFSVKQLAPKLERISPSQGLKRMFSMRSILELTISLLKFAVILSVAVAVLWHQSDDILHLEDMPIQVALQHGISDLLFSTIVIASSLLLFAAIDAPYQLWEHMKKLKMTTQEIKDEIKHTEGSPETRQRIRKQQQELTQSRMIIDLKTADVVITDSNLYAIAIKYNQDNQDVPRVIAKGKHLIAQQICNQAKSHKILIVSAPQLAHSLYYYTPLHHDIPKGLYVAVAKILAYAYQLDRYHAGLTQEPEIPDGVELQTHLSSTL